MCGVFGIWGHPEAANLSYLGLHALQHRGQESAGIVTTDGRQLFAHRDMGLVHDVFPQRALDRLPGEAAIGHVRYSTAGGSHIRNAQPFAVDYARGSIAVAHNGNLTNARDLREKLETRGSIFLSNSDTEVIVHLIAGSTQRALDDRIAEVLAQTRGAYSLVFLTEEELIAVRDPWGFRPLCLGEIGVPGRDKPAYVIASEDTSFNLIGARFVREIEPGEMLCIGPKGLRSRKLAKQDCKLCVFEYVYFARPDSVIAGRSVYHVRQAFGRRLAEEHPAECDIVIPVPDSGVPSAMGYAKRAARPFEMGLIRSHYVGRTFIEPQQTIRHFGVKLKFTTVRALIDGKRVVVIDDSIVRGTTMRKIVTMIRDAGAKQVHVRISSPPTAWPCYYGIDTPTRRELIAANQTVEQIRDYVGADSMGYLSHEGLMAAVQDESSHGQVGLCGACFTGNYPVAVDDTVPPRHLRLVRV
ncbi:MAG: amidophosphoribosyltransferase [Deltaproteobacteria bacterium]|nr:amidophosphoribosyltransferase [Deltaproteobacteria bacterium]